MPTADDVFDYGLLSPATAGSDEVVSDAAVARALLDTEQAYLRALELARIAPDGLAATMAAVSFPPPAGLARRAVLGGNPVIPLLSDLRAGLPPEIAVWMHRGATSQDILDSALMLTAHRARAVVLDQLGVSISALARLADEHRATLAVARTLTRHSTPTTWGFRFATWLGTVMDARDGLASTTLPAQLGGASGTLASLVVLSDPDSAARMPGLFARELGLDASRPWHTSRAPVTRLGDALVGVTGALGVIAANVSILGRVEVGEVAEPAAEGRGASSSMPHKENPVLSVLIRSAALRSPGLASTLHACAAAAVDERPDGAWHAEWPTLRELLRLAVGASAVGAELMAGLTVDAGNAGANLARAGGEVLSERVALVGEAGEPGGYLGLNDALIDAAIRRAGS